MKTKLTSSKLGVGQSSILKSFLGRIFFKEFFFVTLLFSNNIYAQWDPVWQDEFNTGTRPDPAKWNHETGGNGWGNNELQYYANRPENSRVENGKLVIEARRDFFGGRDYSSARLKSTIGWTYGRMEIRAKLPQGRGTWPAIWMLPQPWTGTWPATGEIDIMEHVGYDPGRVHATVHTEKYNHLIGTQKGTNTLVADFAQNFHNYVLEWEPNQIRIYVDNVHYYTFNNEGTIAAWPFDKNFGIILNIAVGGNWGGAMGVDANIWPQKMEIEYVRVFKKGTTPPLAQAPFGGVAQSIPGKVEAERYDTGGQTLAYNDNSAGNTGGVFRTDDVDIEATTDAGAGYNIGWTAAGEWLEYTVNVVSAGIYKLDARVASIIAGKTFHVEMDGQNISGAITVPNTGGWQTWQTVSVMTTNITAGKKVMRIVLDTDGFNFNHLTFVANQAPNVSISSPANNTSFNAGSTITINADASDADGLVAKVEFFRGATKIGEDATSPYSINWTGATAGTYSLTAIATDNNGAAKTSAIVSITVIALPTQSPYGGTVRSIPGKIEAEHYDLGGQSIAFNDNSAGNTGALFRTDAVDIESTTDVGGGYNVGWIAAGEWLEYTVNVTTTATYSFDFRVTTPMIGKSLTLFIDGVNRGTISIPNTGGWQNWTTVRLANVSLTAGSRLLRVSMNTNEFNFNYINVVSASAARMSANADVENSIAVYPNPATNIINLPSDFPNALITIYDGLGNEVLRSEYFYGESIEISALPAGIYVIKAMAGDKIYSERIVKQ